MSTLIAKAKQFLDSEDGPTTVEYAVMLALIVAVAIGTIAALGTKVKDTIEAVDNAMPAPAGS